MKYLSVCLTTWTEKDATEYGLSTSPSRGQKEVFGREHEKYRYLSNTSACLIFYIFLKQKELPKKVTWQILNLVLQSYLQAPKLKLQPCELCNYSGYVVFL